MRDDEARGRVATLETLLEDVESIDDVDARERALAAVQALVELYGAGLERIVAMLAGRRDAHELADALTADELVAHLLLLHDLHPVPLEERVRGALGDVRPYLDSHGGDVELVSVEDATVRLRMEGSCHGCPSSTATLRLAIEDAIHKAAPEIEAVEADGVEPAAPQLLQIQLPQASSNGEAWTVLDGLESLPDGEPTTREIDGGTVMFIQLGPTLYAYDPDCPSCGSSVAASAVHGGSIDCAGCGVSYHLPHAGRSGDGRHQLRPIPLLREENGQVRIARAMPV